MATLWSGGVVSGCVMSGNEEGVKSDEVGSGGMKNEVVEW